MPTPESTLTDFEQEILRFEAEWPKHAGAKEEAIRARLGVSPARYYQLLGRLIDREDAVAFDPLLIGRLQQRRIHQGAARAPHFSGGTDLRR